MTAIVDTPEEAAALDLEPLLVRRPLETFLDAHELGTGEVEAETVGEGHSNVTYLIRRDGGEWVLRRPPRGPLPPSAHDVLREARLLAAVADADVRTPRVLATCDDPAVIGAPFYVMERVDGHVVTTEIPEALDSEAERRRIGEELIDALAEIHAVDWRARGLEGYGKPTGYLDRQLRRFGGLWDHNKTRDLPTLDKVTAWLAEHKPESGEATIVHGDYRLGNTMLAPEAPARIVSIFDWELATIGDPLADLGYLTATYAEPGDPENTLFALGSVTRQPGFPSRAELIARYEERTGLSMSDVRWYTTLALWKSAVFLEGSYKRRLAGTTEDPFFDLLETGVPEIAEHAWAVAHGE
ncbi:MAG: acyl-CoA dehydrogenase, putative phosphotransferase [uncultured Solirubrobacterales bacterium]|uniref:Acyl-CoA dehydrogenase, putative phosphotransferase n=1 Tax=uncultured Solirubrobacterales bacterium TaxID=768556 RepID=A0A6J4SKI8_9ACTN|nr:MAG: acyl-CoA dehydrogenase, putative phosphotransferase [uncultured Solirubrobacterales bacterium]